MTSASASGKIILLGEHAVVYRRPALAVPLSDLKARATVEDSDHRGIRLISKQAGLDFWLHEAEEGQPMALAVRLTLKALNSKASPDLRITIDSDLPIAAGLGSGAAVSVAIIRALSQHLGQSLSPTVHATLAYEVEKLHHGTPSGIDNTVIAHEAPVFFIKGAPLETFPIDDPFHLVIADTGLPSPTAEAVAGVRRRWEQNKVDYEGYFDEIGQLAQRGRQAMAVGNLRLLGDLMNQNQVLLEKIGVSHPKLDRLIAAAREAGALGAKLSGGGLGGNMIALARKDPIEGVRESLLEAQAARVLVTEVGA